MLLDMREELRDGNDGLLNVGLRDQRGPVGSLGAGDSYRIEALKEIDKDGAYKAALEKWGVEQGAISDFAVNPTS